MVMQCEREPANCDIYTPTQSCRLNHFLQATRLKGHSPTDLAADAQWFQETELVTDRWDRPDGCCLAEHFSPHGVPAACFIAKTPVACFFQAASSPQLVL